MLTTLLGGPRIDVALALGAIITLVVAAAGRRRRSLRLVAWAMLAGWLVVAYAHWVEPRLRRTTEVHLAWAGPAARIVFLADFHAQPDDADRMRAIVTDALAARPDVILLGGDFVEGNDADPRKLASLEPLRDLRAPLGVLAVLGNHDSESDVGDPSRREAIVARLRELGIRLLENEHVRLDDGVVVTGLGDWRAEDSDAAAAFARQNPNAPTIVLMHNFQSLRSPRVGRFDLALAGHTHGGQACVPWTALCPFADRDMKPYLQGLFDWPGGGKLYVTAGLGNSGVRARIGARPEMAILVCARDEKGSALTPRALDSGGSGFRTIHR